MDREKIERTIIGFDKQLEQTGDISETNKAAQADDLLGAFAC
jgi:hypothetical protein